MAITADRIKGAFGVAFAMSLVGALINDQVYDEGKNEACEPIIQQIKSELDNSGIFNRLSENVSANGTISISISYKSNGEEFTQLPLVGSDNCSSLHETLDINKQ